MDYEVKQSNLACDKGKYVCVLHNPYLPIWHTKIIKGGSEDIVKRKVEKQLKKWEESRENDLKEIEKNVLSYQESLKAIDDNELPF